MRVSSPREMILKHLLKDTLERIAGWRKVPKYRTMNRAELEEAICRDSVSDEELLKALNKRELKRLVERFRVSETGDRFVLQRRVLGYANFLAASQRPAGSDQATTLVSDEFVQDEKDETERQQAEVQVFGLRLLGGDRFQFAWDARRVIWEKSFDDFESFAEHRLEVEEVIHVACSDEDWQRFHECIGDVQEYTIQRRSNQSSS